MKKYLIMLLISLVAISLMSYSSVDDFTGDKIGARSTNPRITEIAHVTSNPTLTVNEQQAKQLWDSLFTTLISEGNHEILEGTSVEDWVCFTPKEIVSKQYKDAHIFYMQNLLNFETARFMCATYNNKIYLLPVHLQHLMDDMGEVMNKTNLSFYTNLWVKLSVSSAITITDSTDMVADSTFARKKYSFWEERNGQKYECFIIYGADISRIKYIEFNMLYLWEEDPNPISSPSIIYDVDPRHMCHLPSSIYHLIIPLSFPSSPILIPDNK